MLCLYIFSFAFILHAGDSLVQNVLPDQTFSLSDENFNQIARENVGLKSAIEDLKIRLELQKVAHEVELMKMRSLINESRNYTNFQTLLEMQKSLVEPILMKLDTLANAMKIQENWLQNISLHRDDELLNSTSQNDTKLYSINNHQMEAQTNNESENQIFSNCTEALIKKTHQNGIYNITLRNYKLPFPVYCEENEFGGGWTVIQRRQDGSVDFYRNWTDYQKGFGDLNGEFFIGLDKLHALTSESPQELLIVLEDFENETQYAKYDLFAIGSEIEDYAINILGNYFGDAGDSLSEHKNMKFSTKDRDNDSDSSVNCAIDSKGGWWFLDCQYCHLNGVYSKNSKVEREQGINWYHWKGDYYSLKAARMLIKPKSVSNF